MNRKGFANHLWSGSSYPNRPQRDNPGGAARHVWELASRLRPQAVALSWPCRHRGFEAVYIDRRELKRACAGGASNVPSGFIPLTVNLMMIGMAASSSGLTGLHAMYSSEEAQPQPDAPTEFGHPAPAKQ